jgi:hypothetical protein
VNGESPVDFDSAVGRVRKYIPDLVALPDPSDPDGPKNYILSDDEIQSFIDDEVVDSKNPRGFEIKRAAAYAMIAIGNSENLILKKIVTQDQQTDGPSVAKAMIAAAAALMARADAEAEALQVESFTAIYPHQTHSDWGYRRVWIR